jgi:hypothetical protein
VSSSDLDFAPLFPSPENVVEDVRAELEDLSSGGGLDRMHIAWAIEQLVESGVPLPLVMATVFDYAPVEWLGNKEPDAPSDVDFDGLAAALGIDPNTGRPLSGAPALAVRGVCNEVPPSSRISARVSKGYVAMGSEGIRQRPLAGWSKS